MQRQIVTRKNIYNMSTANNSKENQQGPSQLQTEIDVENSTAALSNSKNSCGPNPRPARGNKGRGRGRRVNTELEYSGSSEDEVVREPRQVNEADRGLDPLERAMKIREESQGKWLKHDQNLAGGDACTLRESHLLFRKLPEIVAGLLKVGPKPLEDFLTNIGALVVKWGSIRDDMLYRPVRGDLGKTNRIITASLDVLTKFRENYNQISNSPSAISSLVSFYQDPVFSALYGPSQVEESVGQLKAFARNNRTLAAMSFSGLLKWKPAHVFRAQGGGKRKYGGDGQYYNGRSYRSDKNGDSKGESRAYKQTRI